MLPVKYWFVEGLFLTAAFGSIFGLLVGMSSNPRFIRLAYLVLLISFACLWAAILIAILIGIFS